MQALLEAEREASSKVQLALESKLEEHGLGHEALEAKLEAERERRIAHVQQIAVRRIGQLALGRGWSAWHEQWELERRTQQRLRTVGGRLMRPKLSAAVSHWRRDWEATVLEAERAASESSFAEQLKGQHSSLSSELQQARPRDHTA